MPIEAVTDDESAVQMPSDDDFVPKSIDLVHYQFVSLSGGGYAISWTVQDSITARSHAFIRIFDASGEMVGEDNLGNGLDEFDFTFPIKPPTLTATADGGVVLAYPSFRTIVATYGADGDRDSLSLDDERLAEADNNAGMAFTPEGRGLSLELDPREGLIGRYRSVSGEFGSFFTLAKNMEVFGREIKICALSDGRFALAWQNNDLEIFTAILKGKVLSTPRHVDGNMLSDITALDGGGFAIGSSTTEAGIGSTLSVFGTDGKLDHKEHFGTGFAATSKYPFVAQLDDGRIAVASQDLAGDLATDYGILVNFFGSDGSKLGQTIVAAAVEGQTMGRPRIDALPDDRLIVTWATQVGDAEPIIHTRVFDPTKFTAPDSGDGWTGGDFADQISGGAGFDILDGAGGADVIHGGGASDQLWGGAGNDTISGDADGDFIFGGAGVDDISGGTGGDQIFIDAGEDAAGETCDGGDDYDILNVIGPTKGKVDLSNDQIIAIEELQLNVKLVIVSAQQAASFDAISFSGKKDVLRIAMDVGDGSFDASTLALQTFGEGQVHLDIIGTSSGETIGGSAYADMITGGKGEDLLTGGDSADTFLFARGFGRDTITDFHTSGKQHDTIELSKIKGLDDFKEVLSHAKNHGDDVWITSGKDVLILADVHKSDLSKADFDF